MIYILYIMCAHWWSTPQQRKCPFTTEMKKQIVDGDLLTDEHMFFAQELLRIQFPKIDGWQSTILAQNNGFLPAKMDAIQIHIVSDSHWAVMIVGFSQ